MSTPIEVMIDPTRPGSAELRARVGSAAERLGARLRVVEDAVHALAIGGHPVPADEAAPADWLLEAALLGALAPRHVLFLCVANSARSQLAEGIARSLAPAGVRVSSAGSAPTSVRPEAIRVLAEIGVDISGHRSRGIDEVEGLVDAVITLCAEEVCPAWLGSAWRLHWGLPDPAGAPGGEAARLEAFRAARNELRVRLGALFARWGGRA